MLGEALNAASAMFATSEAVLLVQPPGSPSVTRMTMPSWVGLLVSQLSIASRPPSSAGRIGVPPDGLVVRRDCLIADALPGSTAMSTSRFA